MNGPSKSETDTTITCGCCSDKFEYGFINAYDDDFGFVCKPCKHRLVVCVAIMAEYGIEGCKSRE